MVNRINLFVARFTADAVVQNCQSSLDNGFTVAKVSALERNAGALRRQQRSSVWAQREAQLALNYPPPLAALSERVICYARYAYEAPARPGVGN